YAPARRSNGRHICCLYWGRLCRLERRLQSECTRIHSAEQRIEKGLGTEGLHLRRVKLLVDLVHHMPKSLFHLCTLFKLSVVILVIPVDSRLAPFRHSIQNHYRKLAGQFYLCHSCDLLVGKQAPFPPALKLLRGQAKATCLEFSEVFGVAEFLRCKFVASGVHSREDLKYFTVFSVGRENVRHELII